MSANEPKSSKIDLPTAEALQRELSSAKSIDDFFGKDGIFARLFSQTLEQMLEAELTGQLGYEKYEAKGRNSGNSRNGHYKRKVRSSAGEVSLQVPRDRNGEFEPQLLHKYETSSNELEDKIVALYARGLTVRDIQDNLKELYGMDVSAATISTITDKVWELVETWQSRPLAAVYPIIYLDALHVKLRRDGHIDNTAIYIVLGIDLEGHRDVLGHWVGDGAEGAKFWLSVITELQARGVQDIFIACMDGLTGFRDAVLSIFPKTLIQRCIVHQIRNSLKYVTWKDQKAFMTDLRSVYQAATRDEAELALLKLDEKWSSKYALAVKAWHTHWEDLATFFQFTPDIRRLIYTNNNVEAYNRQLRKVTKNKAVFPTPEAVRKLLYLATRNITAKWTMPVPNWAAILNQLAIRFDGRLPDDH
jgi:transposase-like protein